MQTAPNAISVRPTIPLAQAKPATSITSAQKRCQARMAVVCDTALSPGARLLFVLLDDIAGFKGEAWPHQATLAARLGVSERHAKRWIAELVAAGRVNAVRTRGGNRYGLGIPVSRDSRDADAPTFGTPAAPAIPISEPEEIKPGECQRCHGAGKFFWENPQWDGSVRTREVTCGCRL